MEDLLKKLLSSNPSDGKRYISKKGRRFKPEEYHGLDATEKEALNMVDDRREWEELDKKLEILHLKWEREMDPLKKEILVLKYDIMIEKFGTPEAEIVFLLRRKLKELLSSLESSNG